MALYKGEAKKLDDYDLPRIGSEISVGEDPIHALLEVETRGTGFDSHGRIIMLFEPHKFYKHLKGTQRDEAVQKGLAYPKWGTRPYPRDSYPRLDEAMAINEKAALLSASWGLGQLMGENYAMAGYDNVEDMVSAFAGSEAAQLEAMINFIKSAGIDDDLRRIEKKIDSGQAVTSHDWVPIVRVYNGAGYAKNDYHNRAAKALNRWRKIKDTPYGKDTPIQEHAAVETAYHESATDNAAELDVQAQPEKQPDVDKGTTTAAPEPAAQTEGAQPPAEAINIKASAPSFASKITTFSPPAGATAVLLAIWKFAQNVPPWGWAIIAGVFTVILVVTAWLWNRSMDRANARTLMVGNAAADKDKNNLRLI